MQLKLITIIVFCLGNMVQAQQKTFSVNDSFNHVEEKLNMYTTPFDAGDMLLMATKDDGFLSIEYKQNSEDNSLMKFYTCKILQKNEFLTEVKGNLILKSKTEKEQEISIEILEATTSNGSRIEGKDIESLGILEQDLYQFIKK